MRIVRNLRILTILTFLISIFCFASFVKDNKIFDSFLVILDKQIKNILFRFCRFYKNLHWHKWHKWHKLSFNTHFSAISATSATLFFCFALSALSALSPSKVQIVQIVQCHFFINLSLYSIIYIVYNTDQLNL